MADNRKYYYLKLKEDFFDSDDDEDIRESEGRLFVQQHPAETISEKPGNSGRLMYRNVIPHTPEILATSTGHQVGTVEKALDVFKRLGLIEVLDNGAIYMMDIQNFIGQSSSEADRQRRILQPHRRLRGG
ncbi:MAG: phage replisome organizer N-terminal domain-containing protein [Lachnospira sp.]